MNLLILTNLYPNSKQPGRGIFNKQQFAALSKLCSLRVVAPLPWAPKTGRNPGWRMLNSIPSREEIDGITVYHPRHLVIPKFGRALYGQLMYHGIKSCLAQIRGEFPFDLILACWAYPDAYAGMLAARHFHVPYLVKVHGSDVNLYGKSFLRRRMMVQAFNASARVIAVSSPLKEQIRAMGVPAQKVRLVVNGVNTAMFKPIDSAQARASLGIPTTGRVIVFIGNLTAVKGVEYLIAAMPSVPQDVALFLCGEGELRSSLQGQAEFFKVKDRVRFVGRVAHAQIPLWLNAADIFCLPSLQEGCPNVVLESLACATTVVASRVGGIPDLVTDSAHGLLVPPGNSGALATALNAALESERKLPADRPAAVRRGWDDAAGEIYQEMRAILERKTHDPE